MHTDRRANLQRIAIVALIVPGLLLAQRSRAPKTKTTPKAQDIATAAITMRGTLKLISKKQILMDTAEEQTVTFRRVKKTSFFKGAKEIRETEFQAGAAIAVEATREPDGEFDALRVYLGEPPGSPANRSPAFAEPHEQVERQPQTQGEREQLPAVVG